MICSASKPFCCAQERQCRSTERVESTRTPSRSKRIAEQLKIGILFFLPQGLQHGVVRRLCRCGRLRRFRSEIRTAWLEFLESRALVRGKARLSSFARRTLRLSRSARPHTDFGYFVLEGRRGWVGSGSMVCWALSR